MAGGKSDYLENKLLDTALGGPDYAHPATVYLAMFTARGTLAQADAGTNFVEPTGGAYARLAVVAANWAAAAAGAKSNGVQLNFATATADWGKIVAWGIYDALAGNLMYWGDLLGPIKASTAVAATDIFTSAAHGFVDGVPVQVEAVAGQVLPAGVVAGTTYWTRDTTANTFKLAAALGGAAIDITADGGCNVRQDSSKNVNAGDTLSIPVASLVLTED